MSTKLKERKPLPETKVEPEVAVDYVAKVKEAFGACRLHGVPCVIVAIGKNGKAFGGYNGNVSAVEALMFSLAEDMGSRVARMKATSPLVDPNGRPVQSGQGETDTTPESGKNEEEGHEG